MKCPVCQNSTQVTNSRSADHGRAVKRRRVCLRCSRRFTTYERIELFGLQVVKRSGVKEPYVRHKLELGLRKALEKRPVTEEQFLKLVSLVENDIFNLEKEGLGQVNKTVTFSGQPLSVSVEFSAGNAGSMDLTTTIVIVVVIIVVVVIGILLVKRRRSKATELPPLSSFKY